MKDYIFKPKDAFEIIKNDWVDFKNKLQINKWVVGISGGKDSTVVAYLAAKIFGAGNVIGVMMPNGYQHDIECSFDVVNNLKINSVVLNIKNAYDSLLKEISDNLNIGVLKEIVEINIPPKLRTTVLYAVAQQFNGIVLNTSNLTEDYLGYATLWGDTCGSYAPIQGLTVTEIIKLGEWLNVPNKLIRKVPADGLQNLTDEDKLGVKYADVDNFIRKNISLNDKFLKNIAEKYFKNKFKTDMIHIEGSKFLDFPKFIPDKNIL